MNYKEKKITSHSLFEIQESINDSCSLSSLKSSIEDCQKIIKLVKNNAQNTDISYLESSGDYIIDAYSFIESSSWDDLDNAVRKSLTDVLEIISADADEEGYDSYMDFLQSNHGELNACKKHFIIEYFLYNAAEEFSCLECLN